MVALLATKKKKRKRTRSPRPPIQRAPVAAPQPQARVPARPTPAAVNEEASTNVLGSPRKMHSLLRNLTDAVGSLQKSVGAMQTQIGMLEAGAAGAADGEAAAIDLLAAKRSQSAAAPAVAAVLATRPVNLPSVSLEATQELADAIAGAGPTPTAQSGVDAEASSPTPGSVAASGHAPMPQVAGSTVEEAAKALVAKNSLGAPLGTPQEALIFFTLFHDLPSDCNPLIVDGLRLQDGSTDGQDGGRYSFVEGNPVDEVADFEKRPPPHFLLGHFSDPQHWVNLIEVALDTPLLAAGPTNAEAGDMRKHGVVQNAEKTKRYRIHDSGMMPWGGPRQGEGCCCVLVMTVVSCPSL